MNPRQQTMFRSHVTQLGEPQRLLGKWDLVEHFSTIVEFDSRFRYGQSGVANSHRFSGTVRPLGHTFGVILANNWVYVQYRLARDQQSLSGARGGVGWLNTEKQGR